jgi:hypothetical protein
MTTEITPNAPQGTANDTTAALEGIIAEKMTAMRNTDS